MNEKLLALAIVFLGVGELAAAYSLICVWRVITRIRAAAQEVVSPDVREGARKKIEELTGKPFVGFVSRGSGSRGSPPVLKPSGVRSTPIPSASED